MVVLFFFSSRRRHTRCALVTGVQTCALPVIGEVAPGTPAAQASMKPGELIQEVAGQPVATWQDVRWMLLQKSADTSSVAIRTIHGNNEIHVHQLALPALDASRSEERSVRIECVMTCRFRWSPFP